MYLRTQTRDQEQGGSLGCIPAELEQLLCPLLAVHITDLALVLYIQHSLSQLILQNQKEGKYLVLRCASTRSFAKFTSASTDKLTN